MAGAIPNTGLQGATLREAVTEFRAIIEAVREALKAKLRSPENPDPWPCIEGIWPDRVVVEWKGGYWQYSYTLDDAGTAVLGDAVKVVEEYRPVASAATMIEAVGTAQAEPNGTIWLVRVIRSGVSKNRYDYPPAVLREAAPLFEGARVMEKPDAVHLQGGGKDTRNIIGQLRNARYVEAAPDQGEIRAELHLLEASGLPAKFLEMYRRNMADLFGFSIDAFGTDRPKGAFREAVSITKVNSVDLIVEPGAGGQIIHLIEAAPQEPADMALRTRMIEAVKAKHGGALPAGLNTDDDAALEAAYREAVTVQAPAQTGVDPAALDEKIRMVEARASARAAIAGSTLPPPAKDKLLADFEKRVSFREADVTAAIETERAYLARFTEAGHVRGLGEGRIEGGEDRADKIKKMWDDFFDPAKRAVSLREAYIETTGDRDVSGLFRNCNPARLREAAGAAEFREAVSAATFGNILGDSITRALTRDYQNLPAYQDWRWLADIVPIRDFRINQRPRMGGYGNLPTVAENGAYGALTSPGDVNESYSVAKRGGTETISIETIANDDVGVIRRIPMKLATAASRTLYEFVYDFLRTPPTLGDSVALFHASRGNLGSAAFSATSYAAARLAMKQRTELSSGKRLGVVLKHLIVPGELEEAAYNAFARDTNLDPKFIQSAKPTVHVVDYWTDANDWVATADKLDVPLIELGFYNGNEEPEVFIQDLPTQGSLFSNDQIKYKIRHIYGGNVLDHVGFYKAVVP